MRWIEKFDDLRLDIVGIIAVLGEGSVTRNAQVTGLTWWSTIPRLLPAPQALLEHERKYRLPTATGVVAGAYSGTIKKEINFFAQLLHPKQLADYEVELVQVTRRKQQVRSFGPKQYGPLFFVSWLGFAMATGLIALSVYYKDGFSLLATIMLSMVSSFAGLGTHWDLVFQEPTLDAKRDKTLPRSDVLIYYPNGAIRVIRAESEKVARLYFQTEHAEYIIDDTPYRTLALLSTIMLMGGVVSLANSQNILQVAFVATYFTLNAVYWAVSALNPFTFHWQHAYKVDVLPIKRPTELSTEQDRLGGTAELKMKVKKLWHRFQNAWVLSKRQDRAKTMVPTEARNFTAALWTAIALTGTTQWLNEATAIAPMNDVWRAWLAEAEEHITTYDKWEGRFKLHRRPRIATGLDWTFTAATSKHKEEALQRRQIMIASWDYQGALTRILAEYAGQTRKPNPDETEDEDEVDELSSASEKSTAFPRPVLEV
ncbi:uncharacterized protein A1O9_06260 [Exophiala aquamarina CBS 119918]|uniref:Uncharacterized protein n=1 Tax=Exophiala aquamarina CBS 119918 TaxID=1182545 RepID=A0A072PE28_9EURO|nr:uncharacterized protein A1O9_06260 [Exophiala aquamarina CBS 119918]KEF58334.1 hypothetical protein A1O9_06260 [Exophiala aquamarina CBS 119918]